MRHVDNIGGPGVQRRRRAGLIWTALTGVAIVLLVITHASPLMRLLIAIPVGLAAVNLLQALEKT